MINISDRIIAFDKLGRILLELKNNKSFYDVFINAQNQNPWFTKWNIFHALDAIGLLLNRDVLLNWIDEYTFNIKSKKIGVIVPSNIPLVGFNDFLSIIISGHFFIGKLSSSNNILLPFVANILCDIDSRFRKYITFSDDLSDIDIVIATGGDNSSDFFNYYYGNCRKFIVRKNRTSVAILSGLESLLECRGLVIDISTYFGLGCRNVSKIFIPNNFDWTTLIQAFKAYNYQLNDNYIDNLNYQKTLLKMNGIDFLSIDNLIFVETGNLSNSIGLINYEYYDDISHLSKKISNYSDSIQCVVSNMEMFNNSIDFGQAQSPTLYDWPDGLNVLRCINE